jgi:hypothetical protein
MAHIQKHTKHDFETLKFLHFLSYPQRKRCWENAFSASENSEFDKFSLTLEFKILSLFMKNNWWPTSRTTQDTNSKHKNFTIFSLILREFDAEKSSFQPAIMQKMTNFFMTLEFKILRLFSKNKWWLTSRTTQNTTSKHKNFTILYLILRDRCWENALSDSENAENDQFFNDFGIQNFEFIYEEQVMAHIKKHETRLRNIKIATFFLLSSEK